MTKYCFYLYLALLLAALPTGLASRKRHGDYPEGKRLTKKPRQVIMEQVIIPLCLPGQHTDYEIPSFEECGIKSSRIFMFGYDHPSIVSDPSIDSATKAIVDGICKPTLTLFQLLFHAHRTEAVKKCINEYKMEPSDMAVVRVLSDYPEYLIRDLQCYFK